MALLLNVGLIIFAFMLIMFVIGTAEKNNGLVDIGWGLGFCFVALYCFAHLAEGTIRQFLITILVFIWGIRLALYLFKRNKGKAEDFRYAKWRKDWGKWVYIRGFFQIYMLQGFLMLLIALPIIQINVHYNKGINVLDAIGLVLWIIGFYFEAVGDAQKSKFKADPRNEGKIMRSGLWAYTRHPNYFGEVLVWWGIFCIAMANGNFFPSIISPVLVTFLLTKVSGVAMLERKYIGNAEYEQYKKEVPGFWPRLM